MIADHGVEYERGKYADSNPTDEYVKVNSFLIFAFNFLKLIFF